MMAGVLCVTTEVLGATSEEVDAMTEVLCVMTGVLGVMTEVLGVMTGVLEATSGILVITTGKVKYVMHLELLGLSDSYPDDTQPFICTVCHNLMCRRVGYKLMGSKPRMYSCQ